MADKPEEATPIGFTDQSGTDIQRVAGLVWLGNQLTGSPADDEDISLALIAADLPDSYANIQAVKAILDSK